jgi:hypothetical protein
LAVTKRSLWVLLSRRPSARRCNRSRTPLRLARHDSLMATIGLQIFWLFNFLSSRMDPDRVKVNRLKLVIGFLLSFNIVFQGSSVYFPSSLVQLNIYFSFLISIYFCF